mgnify:CR=1 FL=1
MRQMHRRDEMANEAIQKNLRKFIRERGVTQAYIARATGLTEVSISRYVNGEHTPSSMSLLKLARALHVSIDDFFEV